MDFRELLVTEGKLPILNEYGRIQKNETAEYSRFDGDDAGTSKNGCDSPIKPIDGSPGVFIFEVPPRVF